MWAEHWTTAPLESGDNCTGDGGGGMEDVDIVWCGCALLAAWLLSRAFVAKASGVILARKPRVIHEWKV